MTEHPKIARVRVYPGVDGDYRWQAFATNGEEIAESSEGYRNHLDALSAAQALYPGVEIEDVVVE